METDTGCGAEELVALLLSSESGLSESRTKRLWTGNLELFVLSWRPRNVTEYWTKGGISVALERGSSECEDMASSDRACHWTTSCEFLTCDWILLTAMVTD